MEAQQQVAQLQQFLEEDSESHPKNKQAKADRAELITLRCELSTFHSTHWITSRELEKAKATHERLVVESLAHTRSISDWKKSFGSLQKQLEDKTRELATLSATSEKKDKELECLRRVIITMSSLVRLTIPGKTDT